MAGILQAIGDFFGLIVAIVQLVITLIMALFGYIFAALELLLELIAFVPLSISAPLIVVVILGVVFKIVGRNSSADN